MKLLLAVGLITACLHSGLGAAVRIRAYRATGEVDIKPYRVNTNVAIAQGTRLLLTCDVTELPENSEVVSYRWFHSLTGDTQGRYRIRDGDPYYRVVKDTLLVDITSLDQRGKYTCFVSLSNAPPSSGSTAIITVEGNTAPFLYTPTSLLPEHSVLTDVQQATGRNGQQWITCRSGGEGTRPEIWMGSEKVVVNSSTANSATIGLGTQLPNGLYHCLSAQSQKEYFSLFFRNSVTLPTPTRSARNNSMWTLTSPGGSRVERYIVEFKCSVRNITYVEKYTSVSASGGTGQVATNVSCYGGLGQLYRVKVWAVSGPNISPALVCLPDGQCRKEEGIHTTTTTTTTKTGGNEPSSTPSTAAPSSGPQHDGTSIGVGVGVGAFLLLMLSTVVVLILVVVVVKRKAVCTGAHNQKRKRKIRQKLSCSNTSTVVLEQERHRETKEKCIGADYEDVHDYVDADGSKKADGNKKAVYTEKKDAKKPYYNTALGETKQMKDQSHCSEYEDVGEEMGSIIDGFSPHDVDIGAKKKQESSTPASATKTLPVYAVVDKCKKMGAQWKEDNGYTVAFIHQHTMPMMDEMSDGWKGVVASGGVEGGEQYEDTVEIRYETLANQRRT